jgi:hypothetical protein
MDNPSDPFLMLLKGTTLICGDGNFSFSLALSKMTNEAIWATSYDSLPELLAKYPEFAAIRSQLKVVYHGIDACQLPFRNMDTIIWNHPHLGVEDFKLHQRLLAHFFYSCTQALSPTGIVHVTLVDGQDLKWEVIQQANRHNLFLQSCQLFDESRFDGYIPKRNKTPKSFKNRHTKQHHLSEMHSYTWTFGFGGHNVGFDKVNNMFVPQFECPICGKTIASERGVKQHVHMVHHLKKFGDWEQRLATSLKCDSCTKVFVDREALSQHKTSKHSNTGAFLPMDQVMQEKDIKMRLDERTFADNLTDLLAKSRISNNESSESIQVGYESTQKATYDYEACNHCGQSYPKGRMDKHMKTFEPVKGMELRCQSCNLSFIEERALEQHYKFCISRNRNT